MKQMILIVWVAVTATLACLSATVIDAAQPILDPELATRFETELTLTVMPSPLPSPMGRGDRACAVVIADEALHLRAWADEDARVIAWLLNGEVVQVDRKSDPDWWLVSRGYDLGFARSMYLEEVECE
jgi:hypothetical protein